MRKAFRDIQKLIESAGLKVLRLVMTGSCHIKAFILTPDGRTPFVVFPATPSDWRGQKNKLAELKRIARGDCPEYKRRPHHHPRPNA